MPWCCPRPRKSGATPRDSAGTRGQTPHSAPLRAACESDCGSWRPWSDSRHAGLELMLVQEHEHPGVGADLVPAVTHVVHDLDLDVASVADLGAVGLKGGNAGGGVA